MQKKYEMIPEGNLFRIKALTDFADVKAGDLGGLIEKENNLCHFDNAWVYNNASVIGNAKVSDNARIFDNAKISGNASVFNNAMVCNNVKVYDNARVYDNAKIYDNTKVYGNAKVYDNACVGDNTVACDNTKIYGYALVRGDTFVYGNARIYGYASIKDIDINNSDQYVNIITEPYNITVTYAYVQVGCRTFTFDRLDDDFLEFEFLLYDKEIEYIKTIVKVALDKILSDINK